MKIERHSPSSLNLFCASPAMFVLERILGRRQPVGAPAHRGTAVEHGVTDGLFNTADDYLPRAVEKALEKYDAISAMSGDSRRDAYRRDIAPMVERALMELRPYGPPDGVQGFMEWRPEGLKYPIVGFYDYQWSDHGIIVDLKTTERLPSEIKPAHARQVALYCSSDNMAGRLAYVTPKKMAVYELENIREHREALYQIALRCEAFLALSEDPEFFVSITAPDTESFYWSPPEARQAAFNTWRI
jgi:hypothetical protein